MNIFAKILGYPQGSSLLRATKHGSANIAIKYNFSASTPKVEASMLYGRCRQQNSIKAYQQFLEVEGSSPYHGQIRFSLGNLHFQSREYQLAINQYTKAIKSQPKKPQYFTRLAQALAIEGESQQALQVLQMGLRNNPDSSQLTAVVIKMYIDMGQYLQAFRCLTQSNHNHTSILLPQTQRNGESIAELLTTYSQDIQSVDSALRIKDYFMMKDKATEGREFFEALLEEKDNFTLNFTLGALLFQSGKSLDAKPYLVKALSLNSNHYQTNLYLGTILLHQDQLDESKTLFEKTIELDPNQSIGYTTLGLIYLKLDRKAFAKEYFLRALKANPLDSIASSCLGALQISQGQLEAGISNLKRSLEVDPDNQIANSQLYTASLLLDSGEVEWPADSSESSKKER